MRRRLGAILAALLVSSAAACGDNIVPLTQIVVLVDSDLSVPSELNKLSLEVGGVMKVSPATADLTQDPLPRYISLVHGGGPLGPVTVTVRGLVGSKTVVQRVATVSFQQDKTVLLKIPLQRACVTAEVCSTGFTCDAGSCVMSQVTKLPEWTGQIKPFVKDPSAGSSAAGSGGAPKAGAGGNPGGTGGTGGRGGSGGGGSTNLLPSCAISSPKNNDVFGPGDSIVFSGSCSDPEVGTLMTGLRWESNRDGLLGTTTRVTRMNLSVGKHDVTLCATDPGEATKQGCSAVLTISVSTLPSVTASITSITQGTTTFSPYRSTAAIVATGSATGVDPVNLTWSDSLTGALGSDSTVTVSQPLVGKHLLTLTATDSRQQSGSVAMTFLVLESGKTQLIAPFTLVNQALSTDGSARVDILSSASISVYAAAVNASKLYHFDPTEDANTVAATVVQTTSPALIRDVFLPAATGPAYIALSAGYATCAYAAVTGIDASMCATTQGAKLPSDETTRAVRFKATGADYLLVGTNKGLLVSDVADAGKDAKYLSTLAITDLANDESAVWIATSDGLYTYDLTVSNPLGASPRRQTIDAGGPGNALNTVAVGTAGVVWVGSALGLARYVPATGIWTSWRAAAVAGGAPSLASNEVRSIAVARAISIGGVVRDILWIATAAGVSRLDPTLPSFTTFTTEEGLPNNSVESVVVLSNGDKVFGTDSGLALYKGP